MGSTFLKRYEMSRDNFYSTTKQYPQLKQASDGKLKSTGLNDDLKQLDQLLDSDKMDPAKLATVFQSFDKHSKAYWEQLSYTPGKGLFEWMDKKSTVDDKQKKLITTETKKFAEQIATIIDDVEATVKQELEKGKSRAQTNAVLKTIQEDIGTWTKYLDLPGIKVVGEPKTSALFVDPESEQPSPEIVKACSHIKTATADLAKLIIKAGKIDVSPLLPSSVKKSIAEMNAVLGDLETCAVSVTDDLQTWNGEYKQLYADNAKALKKQPDNAAQLKFDKAETVLKSLTTTVDSSKRKFSDSVEVKIRNAQKILAALK